MPESENGTPAGVGLRAIVESLLFVADRPLSLAQLASVAGTDEAAVATAIDELRYACQERGVRITRDGDAFQMVSCPETASYVERFLGMSGRSRLSAAAMETLAIIAFHQPITRPRIEGIRGVNSDRAVQTLVARGLVADVGRLEAPGRPVLLGTTMEFLQSFGLERLEDLPPLPELAS